MLNAYSNITAVDVNVHAAAMTGPTFSSPPPPPAPKHAAQQSSQPDDVKPRCGSSSSLQLQEDLDGVVQCGATLSRTFSSSQRFRGANGGSSMRRTFSLRKSSPLAEGYWRIHDSTGDEDLQRDGDLILELQQQQQMKSASRKKKGMILKAWKKLFGF